MPFTALLDSCVLYSAQLRDLLITLAKTRMFRARWTDAIHDEWMRNLQESRPNLQLHRLQRTRSLMDAAVPDCLITGYETLIDSITGLPDENDRHVVAAAVRGRVDVIVTFNLKDFPKDLLLNRFDIDVQSPDEFLQHIIDLNRGRVRNAILSVIQRLNDPPMTIEEYLEHLEDLGLQATAGILRGMLVGRQSSTRLPPPEETPPG